jgi:hypothetical protein
MPLNNDAVDSWNHPKIPRIKELEQQTPNNEMESDRIDSPEDLDTSYASLLGISVIGLQRDSTTTFSAHYEYMYLDCALRMKADSNSTIKFFLSLPERYIEPIGWPYNSSEGASDLHRVFNVTYVIPMQIAYYESSFSFVSMHNDTNGTLPAARYFCVSRYLNQQIATYECAMHSLMVEASVKCSGAASAVEKIRRSVEPRAISDNSTGRPWDVVHTYQAYRYFIKYFSSLGGTVSKH